MLQPADSCSFSRKEDVAHSLSNSTAASPPLHLHWAPAGQQSGAFLAVTSHLNFFLPSLSLKTRSGMSMAFVSLCLAHMFSSSLRQSEMDLRFPAPPRSCQLGCRRKCSCSEELGEQCWGFTLVLIPTWMKLPIKPGYGTAPVSEWHWCKQNIRVLCTKRTNTSLNHTLVDGKLSHESQLAQI